MRTPNGVFGGGCHGQSANAQRPAVMHVHSSRCRVTWLVPATTSVPNEGADSRGGATACARYGNVAHGCVRVDLCCVSCVDTRANRTPGTAEGASPSASQWRNETERKVLVNLKKKNQKKSRGPSDHSPFTGFYTSGGLLVISGAASQLDSSHLVLQLYALCRFEIEYCYVHFFASRSISSCISYSPIAFILKMFCSRHGSRRSDRAVRCPLFVRMRGARL